MDYFTNRNGNGHNSGVRVIGGRAFSTLEKISTFCLLVPVLLALGIAMIVGWILGDG